MNIQAREFGTMHVLDIDTDCTMTDSFFVDADRESVVGKAQSPPEPERAAA